MTNGIESNDEHNHKLYMSFTSHINVHVTYHRLDV